MAEIIILFSFQIFSCSFSEAALVKVIRVALLGTWHNLPSGFWDNVQLSNINGESQPSGDFELNLSKQVFLRYKFSEEVLI
jgi:hypothetical protein